MPPRVTPAERDAAPSRLLVRDLAQLATPRGRDAPLRGRGARRDRRGRGRVRPLRRTARIAAVGRMRDLGPLDGDVEELDGSGLSAVPGLVDCHTHACFGGDRVEEFSLRAGGASYEELHAAGGGILSTVRATRAAARTGCARPSQRHRALDAPRRHDHVRGEVGLRARPRHRARLAAGDRSRRRHPDVARRARGPAGVRRRRRLPRLRARRGAAGGRAARRGRRRLPRARRLRRRRRRAATSTRAAKPGLALRLHGDQFTEIGAIPLAVELGARSVDHLEATGADGVARARRERRRRRPAAGERALPRPADAAGPRARRRGRRVALATDFNPGSAFCESLPLVCSLACTQLGLSPARRSPAVHGQRRARARPRRRVRAARARFRRATSRCSTRPTGGTSRTTSAGDASQSSIAAVAVAAGGARLAPMPTRKQRRRRAKERPPRVRVRLRRRRGQ